VRTFVLLRAHGATGMNMGGPFARTGKILIFEPRVPRTHLPKFGTSLFKEHASFSDFLLQNL
jgi:hypothetical protein